jgi:hypothetical protein
MYLYIFLTSEDRKNNKYFQAYKQVGVEFKPLAMEMHGLTSDTGHRPSATPPILSA